MFAPMIGYPQKIKLITETNELLSALATATMSLTAQPAEAAHLKASISAGAGTVTFTGTDENDAAISEVLTFAAARDYITGYKFKTVSASGISTSLSGTPTLTVTAENDSGEPINGSATGSPIRAMFYEIDSGNRIYQSMGITDKVLYYVKLPRKWEALIDNLIKFQVVGRGDAVYQSCTEVSRLYTPMSNVYAELQFYAVEIKGDD